MPDIEKQGGAGPGGLFQNPSAASIQFDPAADQQLQFGSDTNREENEQYAISNLQIETNRPSGLSQQEELKSPDS